MEFNGLTPFDGNGILSAMQIAAAWVREDIKAPVSVYVSRSQRAGLPRLELHVSFDANGNRIN